MEKYEFFRSWCLIFPYLVNSLPSIFWNIRLLFYKVTYFSNYLHLQNFGIAHAWCAVITMKTMVIMIFCWYCLITYGGIAITDYNLLSILPNMRLRSNKFTYFSRTFSPQKHFTGKLIFQKEETDCIHEVQSM